MQMLIVLDYSLESGWALSWHQQAGCSAGRSARSKSATKPPAAHAAPTTAHPPSHQLLQSWQPPTPAVAQHADAVQQLGDVRGDAALRSLLQQQQQQQQQHSVTRSTSQSHPVIVQRDASLSVDRSSVVVVGGGDRQVSPGGVVIACARHRRGGVVFSCRGGRCRPPPAPST
jgi:hypothetical protein